MFVRRIVSAFGVTLDFSESQKDSMTKEIPLPAAINDLTTYKKLNIDGYELNSDVSCKVTGWKFDNKGAITDYYGRKTDIEASTIVFLADRDEARKVVTECRRSLVSCFSKIGTGVRTEMSIEEGATKNNNWTLWTRHRPQDRFGNLFTDADDKLIDTMLLLKINNPYSYFIKDYYPKEVLNLYQELLARTKYFKMNSGFGAGVF